MLELQVADALALVELLAQRGSGLAVADHAVVRLLVVVVLLVRINRLGTAPVIARHLDLGVRRVLELFEEIGVELLSLFGLLLLCRLGDGGRSGAGPARRQRAERARRGGHRPAGPDGALGASTGRASPA